MTSSSQKPETFLLSDEAQSQLPQQTQVALQQVDALKFFLVTAPVQWPAGEYIKRHALPTGEYISCILWSNLFHITGTDIVRCLAFRFQAFGRPVKNTKKFEEGIFSDLRNLKAGTDASLEEPKSPFLDFLFKNNCIRTQKKQKVFFWYSVPHDRLFLDALERDLKREKAGQETTTTAEREPALSFQFDASQTLFEQLTKAQQTSNSSFDTVQRNYSRSASPNVRLAGSMPPPSTVSQAMHHVPKEALNDMSVYSQTKIPAAVSTPRMTNPIMTTTTAPPAHATAMAKPEQLYGQGYYDKNGIPVSQITQRHSSMPAFMEYSPAPSFMSSQTYYDDYTTSRGVSYEPMTPPQPFLQYSSETPYMTTEDNSYYTPASSVQHTYGSFMPSTMTTPQYGPIHSTVPRQYATSSGHFNVDGSPQYKQRRRGSSLTAGYNNVASGTIPTSFIRGNNAGMTYGAGNYSVRRPSDLRRSVSASVQPEDLATESGPSVSVTSNNLNDTDLKQDKSRSSTPLATGEQQASMPLLRQRYANLMNGALGGMPQGYAVAPSGPAVFRRARSATLSSEISPYPQKAHSCPIPTCGKLFKRLEHLKRHVRTHTQERPYVCEVCSRAFSRSDNLQQHRRTHETDANGNPIASVDVEEEDEDEAISTAEDDLSEQISNSYIPHNQGPIEMVNELFMSNTVAGAAQNMNVMGSMGPPPLPVMGQGTY